MTIERYNSIAISLHWLIAFFLIGLLAMGKYMTQLEAADPLRFTLTQWHKSFGITVLVLTILRVIWRITHKPPALPTTTTRFEYITSHATHLLMYVLMVVIPVSGWVLVSASPLNLETVLFGVIPWPHISYISSVADKAALTEQSDLVHMWLANALLVLVLLHVAGALFHQVIRRDGLISRMLVSGSHKDAQDLNHGIVAGVLIAGAGGFFLANKTESGITASNPVASVERSFPARVSEALMTPTVGFTALQLGEPVTGTFGEVEVNLQIDHADLSSSILTATVVTGTVTSGDAQLDATMVTADWFASDEFPTAEFVSTNFAKADSNSYAVRGEITIRSVTKPVEFVMSLESEIGSGEFRINRSDFGVGDAGQDEFVDPEVVIRFEVQNRSVE